MSSPRKISERPPDISPKPTSKASASPTETSPEPMEIDGAEPAMPLESLQRTELLSQLFSLLLDIKTGKSSVRDFESNAGSLRLALSNTRKLLQQVDGITETVEQRQAQIEVLQQNNDAKRRIIQQLSSLTENLEEV